MQITDTNWGRLTQPSDTFRTLPSLRPGAAYAAATEPGHRLATGRQAALRVMATEVIHALGGELGALPRSNGTRAAGYGPADADGLAAVAQALRAALGSGSAGQGDAVEALLAKVESALGHAEQTLTQFGANTQDIATASAAFRDRVGGLVGASASAPEAAPESLTALSAHHVRKERGSIELVTQDGDVVRIRFRSREAERLDVAQVAAGGSSASSTRVEAYSGTRIKVDVNGSLDAGELEAIQEFLGEIDQLANEFFSGDVEQAFAQGAALEFDAEEIARFSLKLSLAERYEVAALHRIATPPAPVTPQQPTAAALPRPAVAVPALPVKAAPGNAVVPPPPSQEPPTAVAVPPQPSAAPAPSAEANVPSILDTIQAFLERVFDAADAPLRASRFDLSWSVKIRIVAEAIAIAQPAAESNGATLLGNVLGSAAEQASTTAPEQARAATSVPT